jgi:hypothetical protein
MKGPLSILLKGMNLDLLIAISIAILTIFLTVLGGILSAQKRAQKHAIWIAGAIMLILVIVQAYRQQRQGDDLKNAVTDATSASRQVATLQTHIDQQPKKISKKQGIIEGQAADNLRMSNQIFDRAAVAINSVTGGNSFCYIHPVIQGNTADFVLLTKGRYPVYDLSVRLWDPAMYNNPSDLSSSRIASETVTVGTLPLDDAFDLPSRSLPSGFQQEFSADFKARNGFWSQTIYFRRKNSASAWKEASIVQKSAKVVRFKDLNRVRPVLCYEADKDFPEAFIGEIKSFVKSAPKCNPFAK